MVEKENDKENDKENNKENDKKNDTKKGRARTDPRETEHGNATVWRSVRLDLTGNPQLRQR